MNIRFLKRSMVAPFALAGVMALSPVSQALAGDTSVALGNGDTATVEGGGTKVETDASGNVKVYVNGNGSVTVYTDDGVTVRPAVNDDEAAKMQIGQMIAGKGVFVGTWTPEDRDGKSLGKTFNLYAALKDIGALKTFNDAVNYVAGLENWHGHDGFNHNINGNASCAALYDALKDGSYNGEWFIPPKDALEHNLYQNKEAFKPANTLVTANNGFGMARWYWSCTERRDDASFVYGVDFTDGVGDWVPKDHFSLSGRVVRAELRP